MPSINDRTRAPTLISTFPSECQDANSTGITPPLKLRFAAVEGKKQTAAMATSVIITKCILGKNAVEIKRGCGFEGGAAPSLRSFALLLFGKVEHPSLLLAQGLM